MKLFENKVGRPSNELLKKRRRFTYVIVATLLVIIGSATLVMQNFSNLIGASGSLYSITVSKSDVTLTTYQNYAFNFTLKGPSTKTTYYRWFTYNTKSLSGTLNHRSECYSFKKSKTYKPKLNVTKNHPERSGKLKIYKSKSACLKDSNGNDSYVIQKTVKAVYKGVTTKKTANKTTTKNSSTSSIKRTKTSPQSGGYWPTYVSKMNNYLKYVEEASKKYSVSADLIMATIFQERSNASSSCIWVAGAQYCGLMAVNPVYSGGYSSSQLSNPRTGIMVGTKILKDKLNKWKSTKTALCRYNIGDYETSQSRISEGNYYANNIVNKWRPIINSLYTFPSSVKFSN